MINSLYIAETGLNAQKTLVDVISNNIANVNTPGFKKTRVDFVDLIYKNDAVENDSSSTEDLQFRGVHVDSVGQDLSPGKLKYTQHPFDVAIQGQGLIPLVGDNNEVVYTRIGRLAVDSDGYLSSSTGYRLEAGIAIPPDLDSVVIDTNGQVLGLFTGDTEPMELGQIELARFANPDGLKAVGGGIYASTAESGNAMFGQPGNDGVGELLQGYTEESNVSMVEEMVNLVVAQRGYQLNARVIQVSDQLLETINNLRR